MGVSGMGVFGMGVLEMEVSGMEGSRVEVFEVSMVFGLSGCLLHVPDVLPGALILLNLIC